MNRFFQSSGLPKILWVGVLLFYVWAEMAQTQCAVTTTAPQVSILWPRPGVWYDNEFSVGTSIKIKAAVTNVVGSITQVQFFVQTNLIGVVTNAPFNLVWEVGEGVPFTNSGRWKLTALAIDEFGVKGESTPVTIYFSTESPQNPVLEIVSPRDGSMFAAPVTFLFSAEVLASTSGEAGPVEFFVDSSSAGVIDDGARLTATTPPSSVTVSNLVEREHTLTVRFLGGDSVRCPCNVITNTIRVVQLGLRSPGLTNDRRLQFDVVTSFPGKATFIEASANMTEWMPVSTNHPSSNTFTFTEPNPATNAQRFYRVLVPPE